MSLKHQIAPQITEIIALLQQAGYEAYIVGGAVRDYLLERKPKDYDLATSAMPEEIKRLFKGRYRCVIIGRRFRLVHLFLNKKDIVEISTFRKCPSAARQHPPRALANDAPEHMIFQDNEYGTAHDDAFRRDFTINALFYDPVTDKLHDYTGLGRADISNGVIRCIGNPALRFEEDPVRMLRALKLVGQYDFILEEETAAALRECMPLIEHASTARMTLELEKIMVNPYGDFILHTFREYGFLKYLLPEVDREFDTLHGHYLMSLLKKRNEHIRNGIYRDSMSLVYALFTLPFIEAKYKREPGELWPDESEQDELFRSVLLKVFRPHPVIRKVNEYAVKNLLWQTRFRTAQNIQQYFQSPGYANARELASIQNELKWNNPGFEAGCPVHPVFQPGTGRKKRRRHRHHRKQQPAE